MSLISRFRTAAVFVMTLGAISVSVGAHPAGAQTAIESMPLWRMQVRLFTGTSSSAGTDGHPALRFNASSTGVRTLNPPSATAFDAGHVDTYDVRLFDLPSQLTMLRIGIAGSDDWCVRRVELIFNNRVAFAQDTTGGGACVTIAAGTYIDYSYASLRGNAAWANYGVPPTLPSGVSASSLGAIITGVTGSAMLATPQIFWDVSIPLRVTRRTSASIGVTFGVYVDDPDHIDAPTRMTIRYDLLLTVPNDGLLHATKINASNCDATTMCDAAAAQLNTALMRMSVRPLPHDPIRFGIDTAANITWTYQPVVGP